MEEIMDILTEMQEEMLPVNEDCLAAKEDAKDTAKIPIEAKETLQKQHCEIENLCSQLSVATSNENLCTQLEGVGLATTKELNVSDDKMSDYLDHLFESTTYNNDQTVQFTNLGMKFKDLKKKLNVEFQEYEKKYASAEGCSSLDLKVEQRRSTVCSLRKERDRLQKQAERTTQLKREIAELQRKKIVSEEKYKEEYEKIQAKRNKKDKERIAKKRKNEDHLRDLNNQIGTVMGNIHRIRKNISEMERELINIGS
ncbi:M protein, serotype 5-like isoform X3 [Palaemon carinicauda]|uniref:M protein, serotype 5-like isoform X3 n=1 Tax=Palaemon carinicauda TaxID=392227 RepID=UPI0035B6A3ED